MLDLTTTLGVLEYLKTTPFESTDVVPLSGGTANFIYRVHLKEPSGGHSTLILKHGRPFVGMSTMPFSVQRQTYEVEALKYVSTWLPSDSLVKVPTVHQFDKENAVIIMEDAGQHGQTLKQLMLDGVISATLAEKIGRSLGNFMAKLHSRSRIDSEQIQLFDSNEQAKSISAWATYGRLTSTLKGDDDDIPALSNPPLNVSENQLQTIANLSEDITAKILASGDTLVMGDFWPGNIVLSLVQSDLQSMYIIDWELAKTGLAGLDLGQFCAEIHTLRRFHPTCNSGASAIIAGFLQEYARVHQPRVGTTLARTVVTHVGAHLVAWTPRVEWGGKEKTREVVMEGVDLLVGGYTGSHDWLKESLAAPLIDE